MQISRVTPEPTMARSAAAMLRAEAPHRPASPPFAPPPFAPPPFAPNLFAHDPFTLLEQFGTTVAIRRGQQIYAHEQPTAYCWRILSGCARTVKLMEDGRRQVADFLWQGDLVGMHDEATYYADAEAVTDLVLRRYPRRMVEAQAAGNVPLAVWLRTVASANLRSAQRQIVLLGRKTAAEKIASFLLDVDRRSPISDSKLVKLPMSRTDIADYLGLSIETVCRNLAQMQREGTIGILRTGIELRDRVALSELACE
jgi:CRP/FNR family nitrogen fixation transcriptional regulator